MQLVVACCLNGVHLWTLKHLGFSLPVGKGHSLCTCAKKGGQIDGNVKSLLTNAVPWEPSQPSGEEQSSLWLSAWGSCSGLWMPWAEVDGPAVVHHALDERTEAGPGAPSACQNPSARSRACALQTQGLSSPPVPDKPASTNISVHPRRNMFAGRIIIWLGQYLTWGAAGRANLRSLGEHARAYCRVCLAAQSCTP